MENESKQWEVIQSGLKAMAKNRGISLEEAAEIARQDAVEAGESDYVEQIDRAVQEEQTKNS